VKHYDVELERLEARYARGIGERRQAWNYRRGNHDAHGLEGAGYQAGLALHELGALAELAVAKAWALDWTPVWTELDPARPDVGNLHVRGTTHPHGCLPIRRRDLRHAAEAPFVLVVELEPDRRYRIAGWLRARAGEWFGWNRSPGGRPAAYFVPQPKLRPYWTCPVRDEAAP